MAASIAPPTTSQTVDALRLLRHTLGRDCCYWLEGRFHFVLDAEWSLALSPDSAGRFRIDAFRGLAPHATLWGLATDWSRLEGLALSLEREVLALATHRS